MKAILAVFAGLVLVGLAWSPAEALVFTLDCIESGSNSCTAGPSYGTITILDNVGDPNMVDVTIDLTGTGRSFRDLLLNFDPTFDNTGWTVNGLAIGFTVDENNLSISPLNAFDFDISPDSDVNVPEPQTYTIGRSLTNLNPSHFNFAAAESPNIAGLDLFAGVHIQNCGPAAPAQCDPTSTGQNSIKVFADDSLPPIQVPEPATLLLLGSGLLGLGAAGRAYRRLR